MTLLSSKWYYSGILLRILCIGGAFVPLTTLATYYFISVNKSSLYMWIGIINSSVRIVLALISSYWGIVSLACTCASLDFISFIVYYFIVYKNLHYTLRMNVSDLKPLLITTMGVATFSYLVTISVESAIILLLTRSTLFFVLFVIIMNIWNYDVFEEGKIKVLSKIKNIL